MREIIESAKTVEEAIEKGCQSLGLERENCDFEIITLPKKGVFGFGGSDAKVRVYSLLPEPKKPEPKKVEPKEKFEKKSEPAAQNVPQKKAEATKEVKKPELTEKRELTADPKADEKAKRAEDYLNSLLKELLGESYKLNVSVTPTTATFDIETEESGVIIGRRGESLDAIQYLTSLAANRGDAGYYKISIDCQGYREKRTIALTKLAQKMAAKVLESGRQCTLEPMNPFERMVIHAAVTEIEGVASGSVGEDPQRKVVITIKGKPIKTFEKRGRNDRGGRNDRNDRGGRGGRPPYKGGSDRGGRRNDRNDRFDRKPRYDDAPKPDQTKREVPKSDADNVSLYGKIEF